jgi:hypothetical protein
MKHVQTPSQKIPTEGSAEIKPPNTTGEIKPPSGGWQDHGVVG